ILHVATLEQIAAPPEAGAAGLDLHLGGCARLAAADAAGHPILRSLAGGRIEAALPSLSALTGFKAKERLSRDICLMRVGKEQGAEECLPVLHERVTARMS